MLRHHFIRFAAVTAAFVLQPALQPVAKADLGWFDLPLKDDVPHVTFGEMIAWSDACLAITDAEWPAVERLYADYLAKWTGEDGDEDILFNGLHSVLGANRALAIDTFRECAAAVLRSRDESDRHCIIRRTLMELAASRAVEDAAVLRLAAGGFRDMTRIAAGEPGIWLDICEDNRDAIVAVLDDLLRSLRGFRDLVADGDRDTLLERLGAAQAARRNLPAGIAATDDVAEVRVQIPDRPGELAAITTLATELDVNVFDIEVAHSAGESRGLLILVVALDRAEEFAEALSERGRPASVHPL
jgi:prephenate dehydrogenase